MQKRGRKEASANKDYMPAHKYHFQESWIVPNATPSEVWQVISNPLLTSQWWSEVYLSVEPLTERTEPHVGLQVKNVARGFLPYKIRFISEITDLKPDKFVQLKTYGDFEGIWEATLFPDVRGTRIELDWQVFVQKPLIKFLSPILKPLFIFNHNWTTVVGKKSLPAYLERQGKPDANVVC